MGEDHRATLFRMVTPDHTCPSGVRARELLEQNGYSIDEHLLTSREAVDAFKAEHQVDSTPQVFIGGMRIGGVETLERYIDGVNERARAQA